jgi:uncharacterized protein YuzE
MSPELCTGIVGIAIMKYPRVCQEEGALTVEFVPKTASAKWQPIEMVLDFGAFGEILGIEIISLVFKAGKNALEAIIKSVPTAGEGVRYKYDEESDSFYLHLDVGNSRDQKAVEGQICLDDEGRIIAMNAKWQVQPHWCQEEGALTVEFVPKTASAKWQPIEMVMDFGAFGEILGVGIVGLVFKAGKNALEVITQLVPTAGKGVRYKYDEESDSFYLHLNAGNSRDQKAVEGQICLDDEGRIVAMNAKWQDL